MSVDILPYAADILDLELGMEACCTLRVIRTGQGICANPAEWAVRLGCCGNIKVLCDQHREPTWSLLPKTFTCSACRQALPPVATAWRI